MNFTHHQNICFTPFDLPRIELPPGATIEFLKRYGFSSQVMENHKLHQYEEEAGTVGQWKMQFSMRRVSTPDYYNRERNPNAFVKDSLDTFKDALNPHLPWEWRPEARQFFPEVIAYVEEFLPFRKITDVALVRSDNNLFPHKDQYYPSIAEETRKEWESEHQNGEPAHYRIIFDGKIDGSTFVTKRFSQSSPKIFCKMPEETNSFGLGATNCFHGSTLGDQKTLLCVFGFLDLKKQAELVERSINRFKSYVIRTEDLREL